MTMCANPTNRHEELQARTGQKLRAAVEKRASLFRRIADGSRDRDARGVRKVHGHPTVAVHRAKPCDSRGRKANSRAGTAHQHLLKPLDARALGRAELRLRMFRAFSNQ